MTLKEYIGCFSNRPRPSEKTELISALADECDVNISTVHRWKNGDTIPDKLARERIARITGVSEKELFPEKAS